MRRILIASDGSRGSQEAARLGAKLAAAFGAEVLLVHVSNLPASMGMGVSALPESAGEYLEIAKKHAFEVAAAELDVAGVEHEDIVLVGQPANAIIEEAARRDVDCIVLGHTGLSAVERFFMGSVADRIAHKAHTAVFLAKVPDGDGTGTDGDTDDV